MEFDEFKAKLKDDQLVEYTEENNIQVKLLAKKIKSINSSYGDTVKTSLELVKLTNSNNDLVEILNNFNNILKEKILEYGGEDKATKNSTKVNNYMTSPNTSIQHDDVFHFSTNSPDNKNKTPATKKTQSVQTSNVYEVVSHRSIVAYPIMNILENSKFLTIFTNNLTSNYNKQNRTLQFPGQKKFNINASVIQVKNKLYITGGHTPESTNGLCTFLLYDYSSNKLQDLPPMLSPHWGHCSLYLNPSTIFVISGSYNKKCESYDLSKKTWRTLPEIKIWRMDATAFLYNSSYIYVFGGWNNSIKRFDPFIEKIERLKIDNTNPFESILTIKNKWEFIDIESSNKQISNPRELLKKICMGIVNISDNRLLLLGGDTSSYLIDNFYENEKLNSPKVEENESIYHDTIIEIKIDYLGVCHVEKISKLKKSCCFVSKKSFNEISNKTTELSFANICHDADYCRIDYYNKNEVDSIFLDA